MLTSKLVIVGLVILVGVPVLMQVAVQAAVPIVVSLPATATRAQTQSLAVQALLSAAQAGGTLAQVQTAAAQTLASQLNVPSALFPNGGTVTLAQALAIVTSNPAASQAASTTGLATRNAIGAVVIVPLPTQAQALLAQNAAASPQPGSTPPVVVQTPAPVAVTPVQAAVITTPVQPVVVPTPAAKVAGTVIAVKGGGVATPVQKGVQKGIFNPNTTIPATGKTVGLPAGFTAAQINALNHGATPAQVGIVPGSVPPAGPQLTPVAGGTLLGAAKGGSGLKGGNGNGGGPGYAIPGEVTAAPVRSGKENNVISHPARAAELNEREVPGDERLERQVTDDKRERVMDDAREIRDNAREQDQSSGSRGDNRGSTGGGSEDRGSNGGGSAGGGSDGGSHGGGSTGGASDGGSHGGGSTGGGHGGGPTGGGSNGGGHGGR